MLMDAFYELRHSIVAAKHQLGLVCIAGTTHVFCERQPHDQ